MRYRVSALAVLGVAALAACSDEPGTLAPHAGPPDPGWPPVTAAAIDADAFCDGSTIPVAECEALVTLYNDTNGPSWEGSSGWGVAADPCDWGGVVCDGGHVTRLWLEENNLVGPLPAELADLSEVVELRLYGNDFSAGSLPPELGTLAKLEHLVLSFTGIAGPIPPEYGDLTSLVRLVLGGNPIGGTIPSALGNLTNLEDIYLDFAELTGTIPAALGDLASLRRLALHGNALTGTIPAELGNLTNLEELDLGGNPDGARNRLTGPIPASLGDLANLRELNLQRNDLTSIPASFWNLTTLEVAWLAGNQFTGSLPGAVGNLVNLETLSLQGNSFSGSIPPELGTLTRLEDLFLTDNDFTGSIPAELGALPEINTLTMARNALTGTIPPELGSLGESLVVLDLSDNALEGPIPTALAQIPDLAILYLHGNDLAGQVASAVAAWGEDITSCRWVPGNDGLFIPDLDEYRALDTDGDGMICLLPFASAEEIGEDAIEEIEDLVPDPLNEGLANALTSKIANAIAKAAKGQFQAAINQMQAFVRQLEDMVANGTLTQGEADPFIERAEALIQIWEEEL